jgi:hypothetical protein
MTRRMSQRARAQEIYREMAKTNLNAIQEPPHPSPLPPGEREQAVPGEREPDLTARVRALYENSAVPVREIAALAGVSERTLYKYARKGGWRPRYAWIDAGGVARRGSRAQGTSAQFAPGKFAPVKGAAGRFIARAEQGKPYPRGLKAADPAGAARASAACVQAAAIAAQAQSDDAWLQWHETFLCCLRTVRTIGEQLAACRAERRQRRPDRPAADAREQALTRAGHVALDYLEFCQARIATLPTPGA